MTDLFETTYDKFVFRVKAGYLYSRDDFWAKVEDAVVLIGVTDFLQKVKGDVAFLETVDQGTEVKQGQEAGKIETIKSTYGILAPVSGKVVEVNSKLESSAFLINEDPYGDGWIYKIAPSDLSSDASNLLPAEDYLRLMKEKIAEEMKKK